MVVTIININDKVAAIQLGLKSFYLDASFQDEIMWCKVMLCVMMQCSEC